jgi:hypothetical protein
MSDVIQLRAGAFGRVFAMKASSWLWLVRLVRPLGAAYRSVLGALHARDHAIVLSDLAHFCYANRTTATGETCCARAETEGRRQVWLRINAYLRLREQDVSVLHERARDIEGEFAE